MPCMHMEWRNGLAKGALLTDQALSATTVYLDIWCPPVAAVLLLIPMHESERLQVSVVHRICKNTGASGWQT
jgi:hypothetical protein